MATVYRYGVGAASPTANTDYRGFTRDARLTSSGGQAVVICGAEAMAFSSDRTAWSTCSLLIARLTA